MSTLLFRTLFISVLLVVAGCVAAPEAPVPIPVVETEFASGGETIVAAVTTLQPTTQVTTTATQTQYAAVFGRNQTIANALASELASKIAGNYTIKAEVLCETLIIDHKTFNFRWVVMIDDIMHDVVKCSLDYHAAISPQQVPVILLGHWTNTQLTKLPQNPNWPANTQLIRRTDAGANDATAVLNFLGLLKP